MAGLFDATATAVNLRMALGVAFLVNLYRLVVSIS